ncbi:hypothetical protein BWI17_17105 [Betaproteobacteria bacterium GR16-43]|nr:hypothetical protein BWI17_17105 [Betaproteobacteria bacterium GR16-43]
MKAHSAMTRFTIAIAAILSAGTLASRAEVTTYPPDPRLGETVAVISSLDAVRPPAGKAPASSQATLEATKLSFLVTTGYSSYNETYTWPRPFNAGVTVAAVTPVLAGQYEVVLRSDYPDSLTAATGTFQVAAHAGFSKPLIKGVTGNWYNPDESGWGVNIIEGTESLKLFAIWFDYGANNNSSSTDPAAEPSWRVMSDGQWITPTVFRGVVYETANGTAPNGPSVKAGRILPVGYMTLTFASTDAMEFKLVLRAENGFKETTRIRQLRRLAF